MTWGMRQIAKDAKKLRNGEGMKTNCPNCGLLLKVFYGTNTCPKCRELILIKESVSNN